MLTFNATIPFSLYIHIPWCIRKCPYCDFNSHNAPNELPEDLYINRLLADLDEQLPFVEGREILSIFFGGGTPSLFSAQAIERILLGVQKRLRFAKNIEITLEANPGTIDETRFKGFRQAGVNRLSIGIQSLHDKQLQLLGRIHNRDYALRAIEAAKQAGFDNFNVDLMHGLPEQTLADALADLHDALQYQPPHLSWYQLTLEPNTFFYQKPPILPDEDVLWRIQEEGKRYIVSQSFQQYEVSAYAQKNHRCIHNINYWEFGDYLGIGAGAHSKVTDINQQTITRHWQVKHPKDYLNPDKPFVAQQTVLAPGDIIFEFMLNALRLTGGFSKKLFTERTGLPLSLIEPTLTAASEKNLLCVDKDFIRPTELGQQFLNNVMEMFLPKPSVS